LQPLALERAFISDYGNRLGEAGIEGPGGLQVPRLAEFPVDLGGVDRVPAVFSYGKPHTWLYLGTAWQEIRLRSHGTAG
jgi:hypothetical protein